MKPGGAGLVATPRPGGSAVHAALWLGAGLAVLLVQRELRVSVLFTSVSQIPTALRGPSLARRRLRKGVVGFIGSVARL